MLKQLIISGAILLTTASLTHATCLTAAEKQHYQTIVTKAESIKGQMGTYKVDFEGILISVKDLLKQTETLGPGLECDVNKPALATYTEGLQQLAEAAKLTLK